MMMDYFISFNMSRCVINSFEEREMALRTGCGVCDWRGKVFVVNTHSKF